MKATPRVIKLLIGVGSAGLFLWLIFRQVHLRDIGQVFSQAHVGWATLGLLALVAGYAARIERWRLMLERESTELTWIRCAGPLLGSFAANNVLPFRAGDVLRSFAFNQVLGTSTAVVVATLFAERLLDLLMVLLMLALAVWYFGMDIHQFASVGASVLALAALLISCVLLFPGLMAPIALSLADQVARLSPGAGHQLKTGVAKTFSMLAHLAQGAVMWRLLVWSLVAWVAEGCLYWFTANALPALSNPLAGWLALPVGTLSTLIPSTPGYVGTFDFFVIRSMTELGNPLTAAAAYALLVHALLWIPTTLLGGIYLLANPLTLNKNSAPTCPPPI
jgi:uncharacterized protein (TIRG00374 family)